MFKIKFKDKEEEIWQAMVDQRNAMLKKNRSKQKKKRRKKRKVPKLQGQGEEEKAKRPRKKPLKKKARFRDTPVGRFLYLYTPLEYHLIVQQFKTAPSYKYADIIESFADSSDNRYFQFVRFRLALLNFRERGFQPLRQFGWSLKDALYFARHSYHIHKALAK